MSWLTKGLSVVSKVSSIGSKIVNNPVANALKDVPIFGKALTAVGSVAKAAAAVTSIKENKGQSPSSSTQMTGSLGAPAAKAPRGGTGSPSMFTKAWEWVKANKKNVIIFAVVGVVGFLVYFFLIAKKGTKRRSPRRVNQAARMRAAKAAKRKR